jgi:hypothetical protein
MAHLYDKILDQAVGRNAMIDAATFAQAFRSMPGVKSAVPSREGAALRITPHVGEPFDYLLFRANDPRMFISEPGPALAEASPPEARLIEASKEGLEALSARPVWPSNRRALILLPFQRKFGEDPRFWRGLFEAMGFDVEVYTEQQVTLDKLRGDYLSQFGVVYISSHGTEGWYVHSDRQTTFIASGEIASEARKRSLSPRELAVLGDIEMADSRRWEITPDWLIETGGRFANTILILNSCWSLSDSNGRQNFGDLVQSGALAVIGWEELMSIPMANWTAAKFLSEMMSNAGSLHEATQAVHGARYPWSIIVRYGNRAVGTPIDRIKVSTRYFQTRTATSAPVTLFPNFTGSWTAVHDCGSDGSFTMPVEVEQKGVLLRAGWGSGSSVLSQMTGAYHIRTDSFGLMETGGIQSSYMLRSDPEGRELRGHYSNRQHSCTAAMFQR